MGGIVWLLCVFALLNFGLAQNDDDIAENGDNLNITPLGRLSRSGFNFTGTIYSALSRQEGNIVFSPLSIHSILTLTSLGAKGETEDQMIRALNLASVNASTDYRHITKNLKNLNKDNVIVRLANKIYTDKSILLTDAFLKKTHQIFGSEAESIDFSENPTGVINEWVEEQTNHKIKNILQEGSLNEQTSIVLVNAIYFKGRWLTEFDPNESITKPFHVSENHSVQVKMMHVSSSFQYKEMADSGAQVLELPYTGEQISMFVILPKSRNGLAELESHIKLKGLRRYVRNLDAVDVEVWLPRFRLEKSAELVPQLKKMGMTTMFSDAADFSGMVKNRRKFKLSNIAHKSFIEVNEEGTEAAGATMVQIQALSLHYDRSAVFEANHPFIFVLYHKESQQILFMGRLSVPQ